MQKRISALSILVVGVLTGPLLATTPPNLPRALDAQRELVRADPTDPRALNDLGNLLMLAGDAPNAESAYRRAVDAAPGLISPRFNLGLLLLQGKDHKGALEQFSTILSAHPGHAWSHYQTGVIYEELGREDDAIAAYARAFALDTELSFADVNPQVLDSRLVERALIGVSQEMVTAQQAPRRYEDPSRIAALLLPTPETAEDSAPAVEEPATTSEPSAESGFRPSAVPRPDPVDDSSIEEPGRREDDPAPRSRVLDQSSLPGSSAVAGSVGVGVGAGAAGRSVGTGTSESGRTTTVNRTDSTRTRSNRGTATRTDATRNRSSSSRPSSRSTGQNSSRIDG